MMSNVYRFEPHAAAAVSGQVESLDAAVLEVSARIAENNDARRQLFSRLDELRGFTPGLRRRRARPTPPAMTAPVTFYSIEEADASESGPLQAA